MSEAFTLDGAEDRLVRLTLNGRVQHAYPTPGERLSHTLRESLDARDVKVGCATGDCGACTVLLDGDPVCSCLVATHQAEGRQVETLKGLRDEIAPLRDAFLNHGAAQCGICTPAMLVSAAALLRQRQSPAEADVADALAGVLCRCTGYRKIIKAIVDVGEAVRPVSAGNVGEPIARIDGRPKVDGSEIFGDDVASAETLVLKVVRSPHPRARFAFGDLSAFSALHGLTRILTAKDVPGRNNFGVIPAFADQPVFAEREVRFIGEAVAAVVGDADAIATLDLDHFPVVWEPLEPVLDPRDAAHGEPVHQSRAENVLCRGVVRTGDARAALGKADVVLEGSFSTPFVEHAPIEPEAGVAFPVDGRVEVHACTQAPVMDQEGIADILGLPLSAVRVVPTAVGGGFGTKLDLSVQPYIALAALLTGQGVRMTYSRTESMQSTTKRHPSRITAKVGATREGMISGLLLEGTFDTGAYASWGPTVAVRVPVHASGPYAVRDYEAIGTAVHTNNTPAGAFRGFGVPQSAIAQESLFEELAHRLAIDPLEFRYQNALQCGVPTVCGQVFSQGVGIRACIDALRPHWRRARAEAEAANEGSPVVRRGAGMACAWYGCGNSGMANPSTIRAGVRSDGRIVLHQGATDIGQGSNTVITQIFATALGVPVEAVELVGPDTDVTPDAGKTSASRQTFVTGNAARLAGEALRAKILRATNAGEDAQIIPGSRVDVVDRGRRQNLDLSRPPDTLEYVFAVEEAYDPPTRPLDENGQGEPYAVYGYAVHLAELEVDTALGTVRVKKFTAAHDVGKAINPTLIEGQVEGGIAQGLGMALMEAYIPGRTENLHDYLIPTIGDMPPVETLIVEEPDAHGPFGAKGLGEHVLIPTAPAILNAIFHATGGRVRDVPATPERVLAAIAEARQRTP
ncbi:MAG: molybdopterin cofactor-binding domain-containing protein [Pseudomonadota bacterium]